MERSQPNNLPLPSNVRGLTFKHQHILYIKDACVWKDIETRLTSMRFGNLYGNDKASYVADIKPLLLFIHLYERFQDMQLIENNSTGRILHPLLFNYKIQFTIL